MTQDNFLKAGIERFFADMKVKRVESLTRSACQNQKKEPKLLALLERQKSPALWAAAYPIAEHKAPFQAQLALGWACAYEAAGTDPTNPAFQESVRAVTANMNNGSVRQENPEKWQAFSDMLLKKGNESLLVWAVETAGEKAPKAWKKAIAVLELKTAVQEIGQGVVKFVHAVSGCCRPSARSLEKPPVKTLIT